MAVKDAYAKQVDIVAVADVGIGESVKTGLQQCDNSFSQLVNFKLPMLPSLWQCWMMISLLSRS